jgi:hypothetical protein
MLHRRAAPRHRPVRGRAALWLACGRLLHERVELGVAALRQLASQRDGSVAARRHVASQRLGLCNSLCEIVEHAMASLGEAVKRLRLRPWSEFADLSKFKGIDGDEQKLSQRVETNVSGCSAVWRLRVLWGDTR